MVISIKQDLQVGPPKSWQNLQKFWRILKKIKAYELREFSISSQKSSHISEPYYGNSMQQNVYILKIK